MNRYYHRHLRLASRSVALRFHQMGTLLDWPAEAQKVALMDGCNVSTHHRHCGETSLLRCIRLLVWIQAEGPLSGALVPVGVSIPARDSNPWYRWLRLGRFREHAVK